MEGYRGDYVEKTNIFPNFGRHCSTSLIFLSVLLCLPVLFQDYARADVVLSSEEREWLKNNPDKLTLWFDHDYPPIEYLSPEGTFAGVGADVLHLIERRLHVDFIEIPSRDWGSQLKSLESGSSAIAPVIVRSAERERYALFSPSYINIPSVIITRRADVHLATMADL